MSVYTTPCLPDGASQEGEQKSSSWSRGELVFPISKTRHTHKHIDVDSADDNTVFLLLLFFCDSTIQEG
jgi:hypothetical protein